ncbi:MAG: hypothetical protein O2968_05535 [Acidobacteria bacterium]|nr:hypothetical protein [Acidobacteriota bacterium]
MKATVKKIDLGQKKKKGQSGLYPVLFFIVVAGIIAYYVKDQPVALELRDAVDRLIGPIRGTIDEMFRTR